LTISSGEYVNDIFRPKKIHIGVTHDFFIGKNLISGKFIIAAEAVYSFWSDYRYEFFDETLSRVIKQVVQEYLLSNPLNLLIWLWMNQFH